MDDLNVETILKAGQQIAALNAPRFAVIPSDSRLEYLDPKKLEALEPHPRRIRSTISLQHVEHFLGYLKEFAAEPKIFANIDAATFTAILDYHSLDQADWCEHRCVLALQTSREWKVWMESNKKAMSQEVFARFIETNLPDILSPAHADILEISRTLEATKTVVFDSKVRLENSTRQFTFREDINASARGSLEIPDAITLVLPVFTTSAPQVIPCRFRYAIKDDKLSLWYEMIRPEKVFEGEVKAVLKTVEEKYPVLLGSYAAAP